MNRWRWGKAVQQVPQGARRSVPGEDLLLLHSLEAQAVKERQAGKAQPLDPAVRDAKRACRFVLAKPLVNLAEELRLTCTAVVINSLDKGRPPPGLTWLEWDGDVEGRLPCRAPSVRYDRVGVLIDAGDTGERGIIHVGARVAPDQARRSGVAGLLPVAFTYDLRDAWELPPSLMQAASVQDVRRAHAEAVNPTPAEQDGSPVILAALGRRFGVVESPYLAAAFRERDGLRTSFWYRNTPEVFETAVREATPDVVLAIFAFIVVRTTGVEAVNVAQGVPCKEVAHGMGAAAPSYAIVDLATPLHPGSRRPDGPAHQAGGWR